MSRRILHFTLGPVQGFISDARRTRDLWAGSFLLSWLSGKAMAALEDAKGVIIFPHIEDDDLFNAIKAGKGNAYIGSLPNRFMADITNVEGDAGAICKQAVIESWNTLHQQVWDRFVDGVACHGNQTREIWERQTGSFWEMNWVTGDETPNDGQWLDLRKNWRTALPQDEPGDKCRLMGRYQELSGYPRIGNGRRQQNFWEELVEVKDISPLDLKEDERLCSIALIKRLFPLIAKEVLGWAPGSQSEIIRHWPSVSYIAAVPWLKAAEQLSEKTSGGVLENYWDHADTAISNGQMGEYHTRQFNLPKHGFFKLDGHLLHQDGIKAWPADGLVGDSVAARARLSDGLKDTQKKLGGAASEFYAVLIMDGDGIGARIGEQAQEISSGLAAFTQSVKDYFSPDGPGKNPANGVLIYAGGDDVLALVPVDSAIEAATALRKRYQDAFAGAKGKAFTLSGALVFAQYKIPLRAVLAQAHHYLDDIAKDQNDRNSLAIAVMKPGGIAYDWVTKWDGDGIPAMQHIAQNKTEYSSSFFYNLRERYAPLFDSGYKVGEGEVGQVISEGIALITALVTAEYKKQFSEKELEHKDIDGAVARILAIGAAQEGESFGFNAALVARFLSVEGKWDLQPATKEPAP